MGRKSIEHLRLQEKNEGPVDKWRKWGPYVSERSWGTVREDYSENGEAWSYFPFDLAASKAYRWGEDAISGWCDRYQLLLLAPTFWNGKDPILKERLFGLSSLEGNHGEDVKEVYYHLDGTPTHSYMKFLYKYPQDVFPYEQLRAENRRPREGEYELVDTGIFGANRYFDIFIEYAKVNDEDLAVRIQAFNRGDAAAPLHILPTLWFRNQWSWGERPDPAPLITKGEGCLVADDSNMKPLSNLPFEYRLGKRYLYGPEGDMLFTENETGKKDAFNAFVRGQGVSAEAGTKACFHYHYLVAPKSSVTLHLRLTDRKMKEPLKGLEKLFEQRIAEADEFYDEVTPKGASDEERVIQRQALAGILWSKQIYLFDVNQWFKGDNPAYPPPSNRLHIRNRHWEHLNSMRILSMPDKWEYPYFCAWDQVFHSLTLGLVDIALAKEMVWLFLFDQFQHPNGEIPACEWEYSDLNPPVQAWAALRLYNMEKELYGKEDKSFLERCFHKLLINFAWWVNRVDSEGNNVFEGGFLGLDNITILDRSQKLGGGVRLQQSDGTGWMAMFCLNMMRIALGLATKNSVYESLATKFFQHFVYIAGAMNKRGNQDYELWSEKDHFFYDVLTYPDGKFDKFRVRSLVGLIPLYAVDILDERELEKFPEFCQSFKWFLDNRKELVSKCVYPKKNRFVLTLLNEGRLANLLKYVWDPREFLSPFGLRSLSKYHLDNPFVFGNSRIGYEPAESSEKIKGGNSNWRGPIWFPTTFLLIDALKTYSKGYDIKEPVDIDTLISSLTDRLISLFKQGANGRPFFGSEFPYKNDPHWKDYLLFYEFFNPETGKGLGASHQTGWTALVANLIQERSRSK